MEDTPIKLTETLDRPDYVKCVRRALPNMSYFSYCGRHVGVYEFGFQDPNHAAENGMAGGRLVACPECIKVIADAMAGNHVEGSNH